MHRNLTYRGAMVVALAVLAVVAMAGPQRMLLRPGTYKLASGSTTKIPARCIDIDREAPMPTDTFGAGSPNIRVKRTLDGKTEEFKYDDAIQFFEAIGDGSTSGVDMRPRPEYRHYEFEITVPNNEVSVVGANRVDVEAVPQRLRSRPQFLDQSQALQDYVQSRFGQTSPLTSRISELQQYMVWRWSTGEAVDIGDALFPREVRGHRYGADLFELEYQARFSEAEWLNFTRRAGVNMPPPKGVFRKSLVIEQGAADDVVHVQGATHGDYTLEKLDALLADIKSVYVRGPVSDKVAKVINRRGHLFVQSPADVHVSDPKIEDVHLIFVSAKDKAELIRLYDNPDVQEIRATEAKLAQFRQEKISVVNSHSELKKSIEETKVNGMDPVVVCHMTKSEMLYDVPLIEHINAGAHVLTCNLFRYPDSLFRTTGEIDYRATVEALLACANSSGNSDGFFSTFALKYRDVMRAQGRTEAYQWTSAGVGATALLVVAYVAPEFIGGGGGPGDGDGGGSPGDGGSGQPGSERDSDGAGESAQSTPPSSQRSEDDDDDRR